MHFATSEGACSEEAAEAERACGTSSPFDLPPPPSLCEWQCGVAEVAGCTAPECETACVSQYAARSSDCAEAALAQWICLAESRDWFDLANEGPRVEDRATGANPVTCREDAIEFTVPADCEDEATVAQAVCGEENPLRIPLAANPRPSAEDGGD